MAEASRVIVERLLGMERLSRVDVERVKLEVCRELGLARIPSNSELISVLKPGEERLLPVLRRKRVRTISGVTIIAVMTKPHQCPKDTPCIYCPGGPARGSPQSYTGREPAALRGAQHGYDPYKQVSSRVAQLRAIGHRVDKVELIILGGTYTALPLDYRVWFMKRCLDALNGIEASDFEEAKRLAEDAPIRVSGVTVETRPDWCMEKHVDEMLWLGVTRVELGVQTVYEDVYRLIERGHGLEEVVEATRIARDAGLKITYHLMPCLPGSDPGRDLEMFKTVFRDPDLRPDALKIYPCLVIEGTKLHEMWVKGLYKPYPEEEVIRVIAEALKGIPRYVRVQRVQRDIPAPLIVDGVKHSNLRELVEEYLRSEGAACRCIRCREAGHVYLKHGVQPDPENIKLLRMDYDAGGGREIFLSFEDVEKDILVALLRLRIPSEKAHRPEVQNAGIVRELHVYGPMVPVGSNRKDAWQHRGYGAKLLEEAERITFEEFGRRKLVVISGLGVKPYYRRLGYRDDGPYVSKPLASNVF
ncbi:tRNA uridine(34) 5-carboxymethylaminomethyl modification radical SAM/GNAT enzyme Elp3 [Candidatus Bathyarchaeota archaeon]|mgnify:CR=1 FL=1|nr:MAG: tRNA uridine(34) 5-carboxymethylaminomethyl modification radical SAM/GNAT enzyme Elp3 [Candidatus Bathyarchaeota archaeon]